MAYDAVSTSVEKVDSGVRATSVHLLSTIRSYASVLNRGRDTPPDEQLLTSHGLRTFAELEPIYAMEKAGEFNPQSPRLMGTELIEAELARGATMLGSLWYTAWVESGEPAK